MASFTTYQSALRDGLPSKADANWVEQLLGKFMNRQNALFMRWLNIKLAEKENKERLVIMTPLRILLIKTKAFGRSVHKKYKIIDIISVNIDDSNDKYTECEIIHCDFPPELSISVSREKLKNNEYEKCSLKIFLPKDIDREFLDILQWSLYIVTRGLPNKFKPKMNIPHTFKKEITDSDPPIQFMIDRYVSYCDAQTKNFGAGINALESIIEYTLTSAASGIFDMNLAFNKTSNKIDCSQFVCLSHGLAFCKEYKQLIINNASSSADDANLAMLMTLFETNYDIKTLEFRRVDVQSKTMRSLSSSLSCTNGLSKLEEINIIDININKSMVLQLSLSLSYIKLKILRLTNCYLNKSVTIQLFNILQKTEQYKYLRHLNISQNQCGKQGTKAIVKFLNKTTSLQVLIVADAQLDGNEFFHQQTLSYLDKLTLLDFSGNNIGEKGAINLSKYISKTRCLNYLTLSHCNMNITQLQEIFYSVMSNMEGFEKGKYDPMLNKKDKSISRRPSYAEIVLCSNLLCLSLDLSDNQFGTKGAEIICNVLKQRENYTVVSLNLAKNNFNVQDMKKIIYNLTSLACLERLCVSENVKRGIGKKPDKDGIIGKSLLYLFDQVPTLNELMITGNEGNNCYLDIGLQHFLSSIERISNLEFLDITGNKIGDKQFNDFLNGLSNNDTLKLVRCNDNKLSSDTILKYMELLSNHTTIIGKLPSDHHKKGKLNKQYMTLRDAAKQNLIANKQQFEIDREMMTSLSREMRLEKELRRPCGNQFGITIERIRGTVQYPDYKCRIPQILVKLKNLLQTRGGFETVGIFRIQPDGKEFPLVKQALNRNNFEFRINDINCIANAIKIWYRELPIKILNNISEEKIMKCSSENQVELIINNYLNEPYKSLFEWLLDLAVQVIDNVNKNRMDAKNMAVVLCPNLYQYQNAKITLSSALLRFTELAIKLRIKYRTNNPVQQISDPQYGVDLERIRETVQYPDYKCRIPQILVKLKDLLQRRGGFNTVGIFRIQPDSKEFPLIKRALNANNFDVRINDINCIANAIKVWYREYPIKILNNISKEKIMKCSSENQVELIINNDLNEPYKSLFEWLLDLAVEVNYNVNKNKMDTKNMAVVLCPNLYENELTSYDALTFSQSVLRFTELAIKLRIKYRKNNPVQQINDTHIADIKVDDKEDVSFGEGIDGFAGTSYGGLRFRGVFQPQHGLSTFDEKDNGDYKQDTESDDEIIPKLPHLNKIQNVYEEKTYKFDRKPMGFQIEAENDKICVRSVRSKSVAGNYGIKPKWNIVGINGFRDWSSMLGILESSMGPFHVVFAVPTQIDTADNKQKQLMENNKQLNDDDYGMNDENVIDYMYEEKTCTFDRKPMGFQIEAENGKISVRSVRSMSVAGNYGIKTKWNIVGVNGFTDWSSMLGILESSMGPFNIVFAVPTDSKQRQLTENNNNFNVKQQEEAANVKKQNDAANYIEHEVIDTMGNIEDNDKKQDIGNGWKCNLCNYENEITDKECKMCSTPNNNKVSMDGATKQFFNFLRKHKLEKYFIKFEENDCSDIRYIEYLLDDEIFLENNICIKNRMERKRLLGECRKLKQEMDAFKESNLIPSVLIDKLSVYGIVTMNILCNEIQTKQDLINKLQINNNIQCHLLWNVISNQFNPQQNINNDNNDIDDFVQQEGGQQDVTAYI